MESEVFAVGEIVIHRKYGKGTIHGEFISGSFRLYHLRLDVAAPLMFNMGRRHVYVLPQQLRSDV